MKRSNSDIHVSTAHPNSSECHSQSTPESCEFQLESPSLSPPPTYLPNPYTTGPLPPLDLISSSNNPRLALPTPEREREREGGREEGREGGREGGRETEEEKGERREREERKKREERLYRKRKREKESSLSSLSLSKEFRRVVSFESRIRAQAKSSDGSWPAEQIGVRAEIDCGAG